LQIKYFQIQKKKQIAICLKNAPRIYQVFR